MIYVDKREPKKIISLLNRLGADFEERVLEIGDFVQGAACVERKTADDFVSSLMDGRLFKQAKNMSDNFEKAVIVISGKRKRVSEKMTINCLLGAMASIVARTGVSIVTVGNDRQLINFTTKFLNKANDGKKFDPKPIIKKQTSNYNYRISIVGAIPGIGFDKAQKIFDYFGSVRAISESGIKELVKIDGIGETTAKKILNGLN